MNISELKERKDILNNKKLERRFTAFKALITELRKKDIEASTVNEINQFIEEINSLAENEPVLKKKLAKNMHKIIGTLEKKHKIVPKKFYLNKWMALGMAIFGVPLGAAFGSGMGNMAFLGIGIPIGMVIGMAIGADMDKKALKEGRQIDIDYEY